MLLDETGAVVASYDYDAYGLVLANSEQQIANSVLYHTEYREPETGLIYLRARWYNPKTGRFLNMDTYEGQPEQPMTLHKYMAFGNNGVNGVDPSGNFGIVQTMFYVGTVGLLANITTPLYASSGKSKEDEIKRIIQYFYNASDKTFTMDLIASLAWTESSNPRLGYWDRDATPDVGIMQINKSEWKNYAIDKDGNALPDSENIVNGVKIFRNYCKVTADKIRKNKRFTKPKYIKLTPAEIEDEWQVAVWIYKGLDNPIKRNIARNWNSLTYKKWPNATYPDPTSALLRKLWNTKDTYLIKK